MFKDILKLHFNPEFPTFSQFLLSKKYQIPKNIEPLKLSNKNIKRRFFCDPCDKEISGKECNTLNCPKNNKITPCLHCSKYGKYDNYKRHEKNCHHVLSNIMTSDFIVILGIIGIDDERSNVFSGLLSWYYPRGFIMRIYAKDLADFSLQFLRSSIHNFKFFNQSNKGRMFMFVFEHRYPDYQVLYPLFTKCENLIHVHFNYYAPKLNFAAKPYILNEMTPNTSLSYYNSSNYFCSLLNIVNICNFDDSRFLCNDFDISTNYSCQSI